MIPFPLSEANPPEHTGDLPDFADVAVIGGGMAGMSVAARAAGDFQVTVRNIQINSGAGFLVVLTGEIMRMPGLPKKPLAESVRFNPDGTVEGLG